MKKCRQMLALLLTGFLAVSSFGSNAAFAANTSGGEISALQKSGNTVTISSAADFPTEMEAGTTYELAADITLTEGQTVSTLAGTLDGKGHVVTLADKPLADSVSGVIQNLGVTSSNTITSSTYLGSMANTLTGTIQNCYSTASLKLDGWMGEVGGLVGTLTGGSIKNSYYAGTINAMMSGGLVGYNNSADSSITNSCFTVGYSAVSMSSPAPGTNTSEQKTADDLKAGTANTLLNTDIAATGFYWATPTDGTNNGFPVLKEGEPPKADKSGLQNNIDRANALNKENYTEESWSVLQTALAKAQEILDNDDATGQEVTSASDDLAAAISALEKKKPIEAVALPSDTSKITYISSQSDMNQITASAKDTYYVLKNDIQLDGNYWAFDEFNGILDGQGHTITFVNNYTGLFSGIGSEGVIQNVHFSGTLSSTAGPLGNDLKGSVLNCYSDVSGEQTCGFAKRLSGGVLVNSYSVSEAKNGALFNKYESGKLVNTYWQTYLENPMTVPSESLVNSYAMSEEDMKTLGFAGVLNSNKGENGTSWGQSSSGYPYFGENQPYDPEDVNLPENKYPVTFTTHDSDEAVALDSQKINLSPDSVDATFHQAGKFGLTGVPTDSKISWSCENTKPEGSIIIGSEDGAIRIDQEGKTIVKATETKADGTTETVAAIQVTALSDKIAEIKLFIDGEDVTNKPYTVSGSEWKNIQVQAKYEDSDTFVPVIFSRFTCSVEKEELVYNTGISGSFYFKQPGTSRITVASAANSEICASVDVTSEFVPVTSVKPAISGEKVLHGRNANSTKGKDFLPDYSSVIVTPENASNREAYTITSSHPEVGAYVPSMVVGYVPYRAGTTTYTATIQDKNPATGETNTVSGSTDVTYTYLNPLTSVTADQETLELKNNTEAKLDLTFTGSRSGEGYSVTEPELVWTYDKTGIVKIARRTEGFWKRDESAPDNNSYVPSTEYYVYAEGEGTVVATGTPVDQSGQASPVTVTITVTQGDTPAADVTSMTSKGIQSASDYLENKYKEGFSSGQEWVVYSLLRSGKTISEEKLNAYYESVAAEIRGWTEKQKPTDIARVALTLTLMGKDITNVEGVNLAAMLYNHPELDAGSNELTYALLALDAANTSIPADAKWLREALVSALLTFQNPEDGGFGLSDNQDSGIDTTAMAVQALAKYQSQNMAASDAITRALGYLRENLTPEYGYDSSEAVSQTLLALSVLGMDPTDSANGFGTVYKNLITNLDQYYCEEPGGYSHQIGGNTNDMATIQALQALSAYKRYVSGEKSYWDLTDQAGNTTPVDPQPPVQDPTGPTQGNQQQNGQQQAQVTLNKKSVKLKATQSTKAVKIKTKSPEDRVLKWVSSKPKVASVSQNGKITAKKAGKATITVYMASGAKASVKVTVKKPVIKLNKKTVTLKVRKSVSLKVRKKLKTDKIRKWKTSNKKVALVSKKGKVTAKRSGKATITVYMKSGAKATCKVRVK